jgi:2'-5' RNA ligase
MRLFIALDIDDHIRGRIARFVEGVSGFAPEARWAKPESLHITLKFIGEQPESAIAQTEHALKTLKGSAVEIHFCGYGFFPTRKSARVFWIGIEAEPSLASLAAAVDEQMARLGIPKEERAFRPHLTLARGIGRSGSTKLRKADVPNPIFERLQEKLNSMSIPDFSAMTARKFFLYQSQLSPKGSKYTKLAAFDLK